MGIAEYIDSIVALLESAGVTPNEMDENETEQKLNRAFLKGLTFEDAARAVLREHGVEVVGQ
jgi:hypothetical protein